MAFVKDLWFTTNRDDETGETWKEKTERHRRGKRWLAVWVDPEGREKSKAFQKKIDADNHADGMSVDTVRGDYIDPKAGLTVFAEIGQRWLDSRVVDPSTMIKYEASYRLHVLPEFGHKPLKVITPSLVQAWIGQMAQSFSPSSIMTAFHVLQGVVELAVADESIKKNPTKSRVVQVPKSTGKEVEAWADEQVQLLIEAHPEMYRAIPAIGAACGLRQSELFGLALEDIDFEEQVLRVRRQVKKLRGGMVFALPKNDRERVVPLSDWAASIIRAHAKAYRPGPYTLPWEKLDGKLRTHNLLFRWRDDKALRANTFNDFVWKPALVKASVIPEPPAEKVRGRRQYATDREHGMHALRHYYASVLLADGVSIKELAAYLGHTDPGFTLRVYAHMLPGSHDRAIKAIDRRMGGAFLTEQPIV
jgi:integrase